MKKLLLSLAIAAVALVGLAPDANAGPRFTKSYGYNNYGYNTGHYSGGHSINSYVGHSFRSQNHCATPHRVRTIEVCRNRVCRTAYNSCGQRYTYHVTVVTYRDIYSNGSSRTYTRTYS